MRSDLSDDEIESPTTQVVSTVQGRWHLLAVFPRTFDVAAAAAIWHLDSTLAEAVLGSPGKCIPDSRRPGAG